MASTVLPLMMLFIGLAVATMWFVALPALDRTPGAERSCDVVFLKSGAPTCVPQPTPASRAVPQKPKPAKH